LFSFSWRIIIKGTHTLKRININSLNTKKNEEKSVRLKTLKDSLTKYRKKKKGEQEVKQILNEILFKDPC